MENKLTGAAGAARRHRVLTVTVGAEATLSSAAELGDFTLVEIRMPGAWDAADLTVQSSPDGVGYLDTYDADGEEVTLTVDIDRAIRVVPADFVAPRFVRFRSGTRAAPVEQSAAREIVLVVRPV